MEITMIYFRACRAWDLAVFAMNALCSVTVRIQAMDPVVLSEAGELFCSIFQSKRQMYIRMVG